MKKQFEVEEYLELFRQLPKEQQDAYRETIRREFIANTIRTAPEPLRADCRFNAQMTAVLGTRWRKKFNDNYVENFLAELLNFPKQKLLLEGMGIDCAALAIETADALTRALGTN